MATVSVTVAPSTDQKFTLNDKLQGFVALSIAGVCIAADHKQIDDLRVKLNEWAAQGEEE